jgi:glutathione S-transferase
VLNGQLNGTQYLMGGRFTVADLNVACVLSWSRMVGEDFSNWPDLAAWFGRCMDRDAVGRAQARS